MDSVSVSGEFIHPSLARLRSKLGWKAANRSEIPCSLRHVNFSTQNLHSYPPVKKFNFSEIMLVISLKSSIFTDQ